MNSDGALLPEQRQEKKKKETYLLSIYGLELVRANAWAFLFPAFILLLLFKREMTCYLAYCSMMYFIPTKRRCPVQL